MALTIVKIHKGQDVNSELVLLKASTDLNLKGYAIFDRTFDGNGNETDIFRHIYFFPDLDVEEGDLISLRTGIGNYELTENNKGTPVHRLYWGSEESVWNDEGDTATLIRYQVVDRHN